MATPPRTPRKMEDPRPKYQEATEMTTGDEYFEADEDAYDDHQQTDERSTSLN